MAQPVIPGFNPDPSVVRVGDDFYLAVSSFEFFPGYPIYHSTDLVNWQLIGHGLTRKSQLNLDDAWTSCGLMAPTLRYYNNTFWLIGTNGSGPEGQKNFLLKTDDIRGEWSEPTWVPEAYGIDPSLFMDEDGQAYYTWSARFKGRPGHCEIWQALIDLETGKFEGPAKQIWEGVGAKGREAPHLYKRGKYYYIMLAEGGTEYGHMVTLARSQSPWGPWEPCPHNPILTHRSLDNPVQAVGHADFTQDTNGQTWLVTLGIRPVGFHSYHVLGRETFLAPVEWNDQHWPVVGEDGQLPQNLPKPRIDDLEEHHTFDEPEAMPLMPESQLPAGGWYYLRNPRPENYSLTEKPGHLTLHGDEQNLDNMFWPTWMGRKQRSHRCRVRTMLRFEPSQLWEEAGLCLWQNYEHHYEVAIVAREKGGEDTSPRREIIVRRRIGSLVKETARQALPDEAEAVILGVDADPSWYSLGFCVGEDADFQILDQGEARYLSTEVGGKFTGVFFALYATGNGRKSSAPAHFGEFHITHLDQEED